MKNKLLISFCLLFISCHFIGCKKDVNDSYGENYITITGSFTVGEKNFKNTTFYLGDPSYHEGYIRPRILNAKHVVENMIVIEPVDNVTIGTDVFINYEYYIYRDTPGSVESELYINIFDSSEIGNFSISSYNVPTKITKVDEVDGYIEGSFEGTFGIDKKTGTYPVKGKFKVKRIDYITK